MVVCIIDNVWSLPTPCKDHWPPSSRDNKKCPQTSPNVLGAGGEQKCVPVINTALRIRNAVITNPNIYDLKKLTLWGTGEWDEGLKFTGDRV